MIYSVYDKDAKKYLYRKSQDGPQVYLSPAFQNDRFVAWEDVYVEYPPDASEAGQGQEPKGIVCHPNEINRAIKPGRTSLASSDLEWLGVAFFVGRTAWRYLFGKD